MAKETPLTPCVLVDLDGTLAMRGDRSPYDYTRVDEDEPNVGVLTVVLALTRSGLTVVVLTGREEWCRPTSEAWLEKALGFRPRLLMRATSDYRPDYVVKEELYNTFILPQYDVHLVIDDRQQCVDLWRRLGYTTLQVADGDF